ncbi:putative O-methyltransferase [Viridothelium virens]|uniref:Putative O-methyltransferase n=1 Tax=Viridothelium virens TaxID=1048519 RepID=A0A6A6H5S7_VIRVR|nr:putative O-methyltransferase [Viridothelium virens]
MASTTSIHTTIDVAEILSKISVLGERFQAGDADTRDDLIEAARSLVTSIELPSQAVLRMALAEPARNAALTVAIELGLFQYLIRDDRWAQHCNTIAETCSADPVLINRILKHLAAMGIVGEAAENLYYPNHLTKALARPENNGGITFCVEAIGPAFLNLPHYLASIGYASPSNDVQGPWQFAHSTNLLHWPWVLGRPKLHKAFNSYMSGYHKGRTFWAESSFYPIEERIIQKTEPEGILLIDIGGELKGQLILQDLPEVIKETSCLDPRITSMVHNFFEEQPVKGARAYFLHSVLHDWNDARAREILKGVVSAMRPGYSKLLIHEHIVPEMNASWKMTAHDLTMMTNFASLERSRNQWQSLLSSVGLEITGVWTKDRESESVIEAMVHSEGT